MKNGRLKEKWTQNVKHCAASSWIPALCWTSTELNHYVIKNKKMDNSRWPQLVLLPGNSACLHLFGQEYSLSVSESMHFFSVWECVHKYMHACIHALVCCFISSCFVLLQCIINSSMQYVLLNYVIACVWYVCRPKCYVCIKVNKRIELALQGTALLTIENLRQKEEEKENRKRKEKKEKRAGQLPTSP